MNIKYKKILILLLIAMALFLNACKSDEVENEVIEENEVVEVIEYGDFKGYLWEITNEDATVYLFGSIHIADESLYPFHEYVELAYENSDYLVVEANILSNFNEYLGLMAYQDGTDVFTHMSDEGIKKVEEIADDIGINVSIFSKMKIWALGSNLLSMQLINAGYTGTEGIDMHFLNRAKENKEILELEGVKFQFDMMNSLSDEQQETAFINSLGTSEETIQSFEELLEAFKSEDVDLISKYLFEEENELSDEEVEKILLYDRNIGMKEKIKEYLETDKTYFIVAGLAHFVGEKSVVELLEDENYTIEKK